jgi:hypothetical protein
MLIKPYTVTFDCAAAGPATAQHTVSASRDFFMIVSLNFVLDVA